ncbi:hypothetical protein S40285_04030 [Stachybotrys chlorohalonatus IBT 40285]|uniref:Kinesin light chain n=1 Tax=Stachybotrys chlorohalonatus (strain IBT 40285) TaxID=1283841 RepID=A0A084R0B8_STAC4|nr:hypothetical protein S40285_04030 [Stachybotrys chlorohalonata IBT 40285]
MDNAEALKLFQHKLKSGFDKSIAEELICVLDLVPLAVSQAAAYLNRRAPRISIRSYLDIFRESEQKKTSLLNFDGGDIRRHEGVSNSVVGTWQVTFEGLRQERPSAAMLLSLLSFFCPQNIPDCMLSGYSQVENEDFEDDLDALRTYSLVNLSKVSGFCDMHSLVQFCTQRWLSKFDDLMRWKSLFLQLSAKHFPSGAFETWAFCQKLLPHIQAILEQQPLQKRDILEWSTLSTNVSWYMILKGDHTRAETLLVKAVDAREWLLGAEHPFTLTSMANLASTFRNQGRWKEAELLEVKVMETKQRVLGEEHPDTLTSMGNLASTFRNQGRWKEAELLEVKVMETRQRVLGEEHPDTLTSMANLAFTLSGQDRSKEALDLMHTCVSLRQRILRSAHPHTRSSIETLKAWEQKDSAG